MELKACRKDGTEIVPEYSASLKHRFFFVDINEGGEVFFETAEDRNLYVNQWIRAIYLESDGWLEDEIDSIFAGEVTHIPQAVNIIKRPSDSELGAECVDCEDKTDGCKENCQEWLKDEEGNDWSGDHESICDYKLVPLDNPLPDVKAIVKDYLETHGYDGLYNNECGCHIDDLMDCDAFSHACKSGFKIKCKGCSDNPLGCIGDNEESPCTYGHNKDEGMSCE
jgi:hypothetical protein